MVLAACKQAIDGYNTSMWNMYKIIHALRYYTTVDWDAIDR